MNDDRSAIPFGGLEARLADWLESEGRGELPDHLLEATLEVTRHEPQSQVLGGRIAVLIEGLARASLGRLVRDEGSRRWGLTAVRLAAAVVTIVLGAMVATSFREGSVDMPAQAPHAPGAALATDLFEVTLDDGAIPEQLAGILVFRKVYPTDLDISYGDGFVPPNTFVRYVEEGELGIRPRSDVRVIRAGSSWAEAEVVAAGQESVIGPGDTFVMQDVPWDEYGTEALGEMWTPGEDARVVGFAIRETARCCSMTHPGMQSPWYHTLLTGVEELRGAPVTLRLRRWDVPVAAELPSPDAGTLALRAIDVGDITGTVEPEKAAASPADATLLSFHQGQAIQLPLALEQNDTVRYENPGPEAAVVYELTVKAAEGSGRKTPATIAVVSTTSPMLTARSGHGSTLLNSGNVLISGGGTTQVELYDELSVAFKPAGEMERIRNPSATLLQDGRVLLVGGGSSDAEVYDPLTGDIEAIGPLLDERHFQSAVRLVDGRVLITGGETDSAEVYDPESGTFSRVGSMAAERSRHSSALLRDQRVLVAGGGDPVLELYDASTDTFTPSAATGIQPFDRGTATLLGDGRVLLIGHDAQPQIYDPETDTVTTAGPMAVPRYDHGAVPLSDGRALIIGGMDAQRLEATASLEVFDPLTETFAEFGSLEVARWQPSVAKLCDGRILVTGGSNSTAALVAAEIIQIRQAPEPAS